MVIEQECIFGEKARIFVEICALSHIMLHLSLNAVTDGRLAAYSVARVC